MLVAEILKDKGDAVYAIRPDLRLSTRVMSWTAAGSAP